MKRWKNTRCIVVLGAAIVGLAFAGRSSLAADAETATAQPQPDDQEIVITPRNPKETDPSPQTGLARSYGEIYFSIPYIGALYEVHPLYRHEVTMQILFEGNARGPYNAQPPQPGPAGLESPPELPNNSSAPSAAPALRPDGFSIQR